MTLASKIVAMAGLALCLSACSTVHERQTASGGFNYMKAKPAAKYKVPEELDKPRVSDEFAIPEIGEKAPKDLVGKNLTIVSPALVLPLVSGSHVEEGLKEATVWFDQVDDSQPLDTTIWNSLIGFLEEQGIGVLSFDKENQRLVTDWMIIEEVQEEGWFNWTKTERSVGRRFEFVLDMKPHGRTAALKVELKDYLETVGDKVIADIDSSLERRNEVDVLNQVISHYEQQIRIADIKRIRKIRSGLAMELGFDRDGKPAYVVDAEYDIVWPRLLLVLRKLGFNVKDLDKSNGILFVNYGQKDSSWWSNLWGGGSKTLDLDRGAYRIHVRESGPKTTITLLNDESESFEVKKVTDLYAVFAETMAADNLDI